MRRALNSSIFREVSWACGRVSRPRVSRRLRCCWRGFKARLVMIASLRGDCQSKLRWGGNDDVAWPSSINVTEFVRGEEDLAELGPRRLGAEAVVFPAL